jgi:hypothetical protein
MMQQWCNAILRDPSFRQQLDPLIGEFTQSGSASYSPCALVLYDYTWRLAGIRRQNDELHWNVRPECPAAQNGVFRSPVGRSNAIAELRYGPHSAELKIKNKTIAELDGCVRLITDLKGRPQALVGTCTTVTTVRFHAPGHPRRRITLAPNERKSLT